jgi:hypothetical protein
MVGVSLGFGRRMVEMWRRGLERELNGSKLQEGRGCAVRVFRGL